MQAPTLSTSTIRSLRRDLVARRFAIPKLQRNFVWDGRRAAKLLDSVYRQMPVGSLFLWEMDRKSANLIRQSADVLPSFNSKNRHVWFVIDGQQRLSVIFQAFEAQERTNDAGKKIDFGRLCFVVKPEKGEAEPARIVYRKPVDGEFVPVRDILASDWKRRMPRDSKSFLRVIQDCRWRILSYPFPVVTIQRATLDEIGEVFIRINSLGMRITSADRAIALMGNLDVRAMAQELRQKVRDGAFALGGIDPILMGFNLVAEHPGVDGDPPKLEAMARRWSRRIRTSEKEKDYFRKLWHQYQEAFFLGVDYIRQHFPVYDETFLPSANMLATIAVFFFHHRGQPTTWQRHEIRKWFWATGVAQRYSGRGYHRNIVADARFFEALAKGKRGGRFVFTERLDPVMDLQSAEYASRSARARAFFCLLALNDPRYLENGEPIPVGSGVVSHANAKQRHHVFPQAQLRKSFPSKVYHSLCNICFLVSRDNQRIGKKLPRNYLADYRQLGRAQFRRVMKSHLIPVAGEDGVWERSIARAFKQFRRQRLTLICAEFEKAAGIKLFRKD